MTKCHCAEIPQGHPFHRCPGTGGQPFAGPHLKSPVKGIRRKGRLRKKKKKKLPTNRLFLHYTPND